MESSNVWCLFIILQNLNYHEYCLCPFFLVIKKKKNNILLETVFRLICDNSDDIESIQLRAMLLPDYKVTLLGHIDKGRLIKLFVCLFGSYLGRFLICKTIFS